MTADLEPRPGFVAPELAAEFPELAVYQVVVAARPSRSPRPVKERLRAMSDRFTGQKAIQLRRQPVPWAYRVFFRQIGIDPDDRRTPPEAHALERMRAGGFKSRNLVDDALLIATMETGVPVLAFDSGRLEGDVGLRLAGADELLGDAGRSLRGGELVVADRLRALAVLFGDSAPEHVVTRRTERLLLLAVQVKGVPEVSVDEALWTAGEILTAPE